MTINLKIVHPPMLPVTETLKVWHTKCQVLRPKFYVEGGRLPDIGEMIELPLGDARHRAGRGHVLIVGQPYEKDTGILAVSPPRDREKSWTASW